MAGSRNHLDLSVSVIRVRCQVYDTPETRNAIPDLYDGHYTANELFQRMACPIRAAYIMTVDVMLIGGIIHGPGKLPLVHGRKCAY